MKDFCPACRDVDVSLVQSRLLCVCHAQSVAIRGCRGVDLLSRRTVLVSGGESATASSFPSRPQREVLREGLFPHTLVSDFPLLVRFGRHIV